MQTVQMNALIGPDRKLIVQLPATISPGEHHFVVVIDEPTPAKSERPALPFTAYPVGLASDSLTFRREDLYGDSV